jgi:integrase
MGYLQPISKVRCWAKRLREPDVLTPKRIPSLVAGAVLTQELLRHANARTTMDLYTQAVSADRRSASQRQIEMLLG